jgi:hypothetical protein
VQRRPGKEASSTKETNIMPFYMTQFAYTAEAIAAMGHLDLPVASAIRNVPKEKKLKTS